MSGVPIHVIHGSIIFYFFSAIASRDPSVLKTPTARLASEMGVGSSTYCRSHLGREIVWCGWNGSCQYLSY